MKQKNANSAPPRATSSPQIPSWLQQTSEGVVLKVQAQPNASKTGIAGLHGDEMLRVKIKIAAPPVDGEANEELLRYLRKKIRQSGIHLEILRGDTSKNKDILFRGTSLAFLRERIETLIMENST